MANIQNEASLHDGSYTDHEGSIRWLIQIVRRLLAPGGCPWDREQTLETLKPYLVEECYEVLDAIDTDDTAAHREELGDLLLQIVFQAQLASHNMNAIITSIGSKLIRRHPHVFGSETVQDTNEVLENWEKIKASELAEKGRSRSSLLDAIPRSLPALRKAHDLTQKAAKSGFTFPNAPAARAKFEEELAELDHALCSDESTVSQELGDALFALANWARQLGFDPEDVLRQANRRFEIRFRNMEKTARAEELELSTCNSDVLLLRWRDAKTVLDQ